MEQDFKRLICLIIILIIGYLLIWWLVFTWYDLSYQIFPIFKFLSILVKYFLVINFVFFLVSMYLRFKKKINYKMFIGFNILLLVLSVLSFIIFRDFFKY